MRASARRARLALGLLTLGLLGLTAACGPEVPKRPPNVLLITLDTCRADRLGCYGYDERDVTPHLDAFAAQSVLFEQSFASSSFTPPSHASLLTGLHPSEHGLIYWNRKLGAVPTAAELFAAAGYRTFAVSPLKTLFLVGLDKGFQETVELPHRSEPDKIFLGDASALIDEALPRLTAEDPRPFFAWLHSYDAHRVYGRQGEQWATRYNDSQPVAVGDTEMYYQLPPDKRPDRARTQNFLSPEQARFIEDRYDGGLAWLDEQLGGFFDALQVAGLLENTLVVITADHGEVLTEHAEEWFSHDPHLVDENVHVPLIVRLPGGQHGGRRVPALVSGVDLLPSLLELTGVSDGGNRLSGQSFAHLARGESGPRREAVFAERQGKDKTGEPGVSAEQAAAGRDEKRMLRTATHKLVHLVDRGPGVFELYAVDNEHENLFETQPERAAELVQRYLATVRSLQRDGAEGGMLDPETEAYLRSLGYLGTDDPGN